MMSDDRGLTAASLAGLQRLAPDADRAERVRARCRARLERRQQRPARATAMTGGAWGLLAPAVVAVFCVVYVITLMATTLHLEGILH